MSVPNYLQILASNCFKDASGALLARGKGTVRAVDGHGAPVPFALNGQGIIGDIPFEISQGSLVGTLQLANPAATNPAGIGYTFIVANSDTGAKTVYAKVSISDQGSGTFDFKGVQPGGSYPTLLPIVYVQGPKGDKGDSGTGSGGTASYQFTQSSPLATWVVTHNLGRYPSVTVLDSAQNWVIGAVKHNSLNQLTLTFGSAFAGSAYLV